ncbi:40S ribosomal protein S3 [Heterostelium album PN500]|uniref:Small ribosomal subunit protein uS3 n=1 Tax=Heterostelium pallidum (strain ATCC 26659 / Pp 5 / PN500) TaxID=670386 RepID=D3BBF0_HETP5|nr:40S ribosomal protein S3 [Heterostelium album PN500]EFA80983.1 40S ribosomal protein S3 [Heterostelium album PN500]|eukprot:XP_020433101.1 40S ribosomal protein S3 [Heterostelium album PN500]
MKIFTIKIEKKWRVVFVADGVFHAELNELFTREFNKDEGYSGVELKTGPASTEIIIRASKTQAIVGQNARRIHELCSLVQKRFGFAEGTVTLYAEKVQNRGLCAIAQADSLKGKLLLGLPVRRACYAIVHQIMTKGAKGCEVIVSGKLRAQRAKAMKFTDGYMIKSGQPSQNMVDFACCHVLLRQGTLGVKVAIMLPYDPTGKNGVQTPQPDIVVIKDPVA